MSNPLRQSGIELSVDELLSVNKPFFRKEWLRHIYFLANSVKSRKAEQNADENSSRDHIPDLGEFAKKKGNSAPTESKQTAEETPLLTHENERIDKETAAKLAHAFIEFCIQDGEASSEDVGNNISNAIENIVAARKKGQALQVSHPDYEMALALNQHLDQSLQNLVEVIVATQFIDRVTQRMHNAIACIESLYTESSDTISLEEIYKALGMEDARVLFKAIEKGESIPDAVRRANRKLQRVMTQGVDLFGK